MASLTLDHLSCTYQNRKELVRALDDFSLHASDRELVVLVGPSGCGKTTVLRLIAGLENPSAGTIRINGHDVSRVSPKDRDVAMVFQNFALYPHMSVYKNMAFGLKMRGVPKAQISDAVSETATKLELTNLLHRLPAQLSGGEKQRVALARAIVRRPQLFLLDEPLSNLDPQLRASARTQIKLLQRELATTMIYVTHDQEEAMTLADRIAVMRRGVLQQVGTPLEIYDRPANRFVAEFLGSPAMNLIYGKIEIANGLLFFIGAGLTVVFPIHDPIIPGREVVLGIRANDVEIAPFDHKSAQPQTAWNLGTIRIVEHLGDTTVLRVATKGAANVLVKTASGGSWAAGNAVVIRPRPEKVHLFETTNDCRRLS